jgi:hypothetical protein
MGAGGLATMEEANLQRNSIKIRAHGGIRAACFGRGTLVSAGGALAFSIWRRRSEHAPGGGPSPLWLLLPPKSPKFAKNHHIEVQILAAAVPSPGTCTGCHRYPWEGNQSPADAHKRPQAE